MVFSPWITQGGTAGMLFLISCCRHTTHSYTKTLTQCCLHCFRLNFFIMHFWNSPLWFKHLHAHKQPLMPENGSRCPFTQCWHMPHCCFAKLHIHRKVYFNYSFLRLIKDTGIWLILLIPLTQLNNNSFIHQGLWSDLACL